MVWCLVKRRDNFILPLHYRKWEEVSVRCFTSESTERISLAFATVGELYKLPREFNVRLAQSSV